MPDSKGIYQSVIRMSKVEVVEGSQLPLARTYHAACLSDKYMFVVGGEGNSDLKDFWALDLE